MSSVRGLFKYLGAEGMLLVDPTEDLSSPSVPLRLPKALSVTDTVAMVESQTPTRSWVCAIVPCWSSCTAAGRGSARR